MADVSTFRLYLLRAAYLLVAAGLAAVIWPSLLDHESDWPLMNGVVASLLAGVSLLAALGLRYPLKMLPVLLFELIWKSIWLLAVAWPLWSAGLLDAATRDTIRDCLIGVIIMPLVIPWRYVWDHYVKAPGERWRSQASDR